MVLFMHLPGGSPDLQLNHHGRYRYSAINHRPDYNWPEGQRLAVYIALHPYLVGQPFRLRHLRRALQHIARVAHERPEQVWLTHPGAIANFGQDFLAGIVP